MYRTVFTQLQHYILPLCVSIYHSNCEYPQRPSMALSLLASTITDNQPRISKELPIITEKIDVFVDLLEVLATKTRDFVNFKNKDCSNAEAALHLFDDEVSALSKDDIKMIQDVMHLGKNYSRYVA